MPGDERSTFVVHFLHDTRGFAKAGFVILLIIEEDHEEINVVSRIPFFERDVGFLLDLGHRVQAPDGQQVLLNEDNEVPLSLRVPLLLAHPRLRLYVTQPLPAFIFVRLIQFKS